MHLHVRQQRMWGRVGALQDCNTQGLMPFSFMEGIPDLILRSHTQQLLLHHMLCTRSHTTRGYIFSQLLQQQQHTRYMGSRVIGNVKRWPLHMVDLSKGGCGCALHAH